MNNGMSKVLQIGKMVRDSWQNVFTGLGVDGKDKRNGGKIKVIKYNQEELENLHDFDDIAKRVVNLIPDRGTSKWLTHKVAKEDGGVELANKIAKFDKDLKVKKKFKKAWRYARIYGGSVIFVSVDDGKKLSEPLDLNRIAKVRSLTVFHKFELSRGFLEDDINSPNFKMPASYTVSGSSEEVHHSRFIRFDGSPLSEQGFERNDYWHDSVLTAMADVLRDYNNAYGGIFNAIQDFSVSVLKLTNLPEIISSNDSELVVERLKLMNLSKSIMGSILVDAENEDFQNLDRQFTNVDKIMDKIDQRLVTATGMPHTIILGEGATGSLSGSGESEDNEMNKLVSAQQTEVLDETTERFYSILLSSKQGPTSGKIPKSYSRTYDPLSEPGSKEVAETRKLVAETDNLYFQIGSLSSGEITSSRFGGDEYSMETRIDEESRTEQEETDLIGEKETKEAMKGINDN